MPDLEWERRVVLEAIEQSMSDDASIYDMRRARDEVMIRLADRFGFPPMPCPTCGGEATVKEYDGPPEQGGWMTRYEHTCGYQSIWLGSTL